MTTANYQKFQFLPPDEVDFRKKMRIFVLLIVPFIAIFICTIMIRDSSWASIGLRVMRDGLLGGLVGGAYLNWQSFKDRQYQVKFGHIEMDNQKIRMVTGTADPFVVNFQDIEKAELSNVWLVISYRVKKRMKDIRILLVDVDRADDFLATVKERVAAAK